MGNYYFKGELWPIYYVYGRSDVIKNQCVVKAPIDILAMDGKQYIVTRGTDFPGGTNVDDDYNDTETKWRSGLGPVNLGNVQVFDASQFGDATDSMLGVHKFGFV